MRSILIESLLALVLALFSIRTVAVPLDGRQAPPVPPATDPFYQPPAGFEAAAPGTVLRSRTIVPAFFGLIPNPVQAYQLLYRTTAVNGSAIATVTTVFKPSKNLKTDRFVSFQTAYDSSASLCDPSYVYQLGSAQNSQIASFENLLIEAYLMSGYIVASSDYEGPDAAFIPGRLEAMGTLDGMRAVTNFHQQLGFSTNTPKIVGTGYSGGGQATAWSAALQPSYAPELNIVGWAAGGVPANLTAVVLALDNTLFSGFLPAAVAGLAKPSAYGARLNPVLNRILTPRGRAVVGFTETHCAVDDLFNFPEQSILSTDIQTLGRQVLSDPTVASILNDNILGANATETPRKPILLYHATMDEIIPYAPVVKLDGQWCNRGASVTFTTYASGGHATTEIVGFPQVMTYVGDLFAGNVPSGCKQNTVLNDTLNPLALGLDLEPVLVKLIDVLAHLGPGDSNLKSNLTVLNETMSSR